jgi:hypothetical protein
VGISARQAQVLGHNIPESGGEFAELLIGVCGQPPEPVYGDVGVQIVNHAAIPPKDNTPFGLRLAIPWRAGPSFGKDDSFHP